ncbi:bifunctional diguanylate cyclase/phosphodiesterase [Pseudoxanthomonas dokdonensis]|uniref:bifunctional diguanylate cyclase/phosphodiesterase n=1 Tax=Pseudoxanthomonas dokdonensis TaxID=344882 RepID=UPI001477622D|nr:EAL domain-containing protein [Pseudoxanthomonas dokdonensis]
MTHAAHAAHAGCAILPATFDPGIASLLAQSVDAALVVDADNTVVLANPMAQALLGHAGDSLLGLDIHQLLVCPLPHAGPPAQASCVARLAGNHHAIGMRCSDGSRLSAALSISPLRLQDGHYHVIHIRDISEYREQQERMQQLSLVMDKSDNAIFISTPERRVVYINRGFTRLMGYPLDEMFGHIPSEMLSGPHTDPGLDRAIAGVVGSGDSLNTEVLLYARDGRPVWVSAAVNPVHGDDGKLIALVSVLTDITHTKMHQVLHHKVLNAMVRELPVAEVMNLICLEIERISPELVTSVVAVDNSGELKPLAAPSLPAHILQSLQGLPMGPRAGACGTAAWRGRPVHTADISEYSVLSDYHRYLLEQGIKSCWSNPIKSSNGRVLGTLSFYSRQMRSADEFHQRLVDTCLHLCALVMERELTNERVHQLAFYDTLTGLPNRVMFSAKAEQILVSAIQMNTQAAVLFINLDRFKRINDAQGHAAGDGVLRDIAARLVDELPGMNLIGRQAGDEFVIILPHSSTELAGSVAERLLMAIAQPVSAGVMTVHPSASIGVAMFPGDGWDIEHLLRHADMAMNQAKNEGGDRFRFYSREMDRVAQERVSLETAMREALATGQFHLHYQPQVGGDGNALYGVEALLRWDHPELGPIAPMRFIPVAEECGIIRELSLWVLEHACAQMARWRRDGVQVPRVSVNMSALNFRDGQLASQIQQTLARHQLSADDLTLEITESVMLDPDPEVLDNIEAIYVMGVRLSLDDFGTGYSSLSHLHRLPIYELKLDQSFVHDIESSAIARTLISSVLRIGESLGMKVVAEGVETPSQRDFLIEQGFPVLQGFLFSEPLAADALAAWWQAGSA